MKAIKKTNSVISVVLLATALTFTISCQKDKSILPDNPTTTSDAMRITNQIVPPHPILYSLLSARWWKWTMQLPLAGNPSVNDGLFNVREGQSGDIWFLAAPFDTVVRNVTIPFGKSLFVGMLNAEASSLEGLGTTDSEQAANAKFNADHIINLFASLDGTPVTNLTSFRSVTPQFHFFAPTPWLFGTTGGEGTSVGDGYYLFIKPLSRGTHTLHYGGEFFFSVANGDPFDFVANIDMTYNIRVR